MVSRLESRYASLFAALKLSGLALALRDVVYGSFFLWLFCVMAMGQPNLDVDVYSSTLVLHVLYATPMILYCAYLLVAQRLPGPTKLDWAAACLVVGYALASATSVSPRVSAEAVLLIGTGVIAFYIAFDSRFWTVEALLRSLVSVGAILAALGLLVLVIDYVHWYRLFTAVAGGPSFSDVAHSVPRILNVTDHPNILAMVLDLALPFGLALILVPRKRLDRAFGGLTCLLTLVALFFTLSRGAWLATVAAAPVFWLLFAMRERGFESLAGVREFCRRRAPVLVASAGVAVVLTSIAAAGLWDSRPPWLFRDTVSLRYDAAATAVRMVEARPVLGVGPYSYGIVYDDYGGTHPQENNHPHNLYLRLLTDVGLVGGVVALTGAAVFAVTFARGYQHAGPGDRVYLAACAAAIVATLVHGLVDSPSAWNTVLLPFAIVLAIAARISAQAVPAGTRRRTFLSYAPRVIVVALLPMTLVGWVMLDGPHAAYSESLQLIQQGRLGEAVTAATRAADSDPDFAAYQVHAGVTLARLYDAERSTGEDDTALLDRAIAYMRRGVSDDPSGGVGFANLALALQTRGNAPGAVEAARTAFANTPHDPAVAAVAGSILESNGRNDEAVAAYAAAVDTDPTLGQSSYWAETPERLQLRGSILAASGVDACRLGRDAALYGVYRTDLVAQLEPCRALVSNEAHNAVGRADLALILAALGSTGEARAVALDAQGLLPSNPDVKLAAALVLDAADVQAQRAALLRSFYAGSKDAIVLLPYTYGVARPADGAVLVSGAPGAAMPPAVLDAVRARLPKGAETLEGATQSERLTHNYYRLDYMRQAPDVVILPGDWVNLASPRTLLVLNALNTPN